MIIHPPQTHTQSHHGVGLPRPSLPIGKHTCVVPILCTLKDLCAQVREHLKCRKEREGLIDNLSMWSSCAPHGCYMLTAVLHNLHTICLVLPDMWVCWSNKTQNGHPTHTPHRYQEKRRDAQQSTKGHCASFSIVVHTSGNIVLYLHTKCHKHAHKMSQTRTHTNTDYPSILVESTPICSVRCQLFTPIHSPQHKAVCVMAENALTDLTMSRMHGRITLIKCLRTCQYTQNHQRL